MITTEEARQRLEAAGVPVTVQTIRRWFRAGRLTGTQVGPESPIMIDEESIDRVIRQARNPKEP